jgi:hypothetical protein
MKKSLHRNVLSCAASPLKLSELESSKQICYQVAASPLNMCALLLAEMITINKQRLKLDISHHESMRPPSSLLLHLTSSQGDKSSSPGEQMKDPSAPPLLDAPLLHENAPSQERRLRLHGNTLHASSKQTQASPQALKGFAQTLMKCALLLLKICAPLLFSKTHK